MLALKWVVALLSTIFWPGRKTQAGRVLEYLSSRSYTLTRAQLAHALMLSEFETERALRELEDAGLVRLESHGASTSADLRHANVVLLQRAPKASQDLECSA